MTQKITMKNLLLAAALCLGAAATASAQTSAAGQKTTASGTGLLGQTYVGLDYGYINLPDTCVNAQGLKFEYNQSLNTGFDLNLSYAGSRTEKFATRRNTEQVVDASAIAFIPEYSWGKPFIGVGAGWAWTKTNGAKDNAFQWNGQAGIEFQVTRAWTVTPYVKYTISDVYDTAHLWNYAVKTNYWITKQWGLQAGVDHTNHQAWAYSAGVNYKF